MGLLINVETNKMKKIKYIIILLLLMVVANSANGQSPCGDDLCIVQFNAGFNEANKVTWLGELNDCKNSFIDIQTDAAAAGKYKIVVVPTITTCSPTSTPSSNCILWVSLLVRSISC